MDESQTPDVHGHRLLPVVLLIAILGISSASLLVRLLDDTGVGPWTVASLRMLYAAVILLVLAVASRRHAPKGAPASAGLVPVTGTLVLAAVLLAAHFATFTLAIYRTQVARAVLLFATQALFVLVLDSLRTRRLPDWWTLGAVALALAGLVAMFRPGLEGDWSSGEWLGLAAAATFALYLMVVRRLRQHLDVRALNVPLYGLAGLLLLGLAWQQEGLAGFVDGRAQLLFVGLALLPTLCGHSLFHWCLRHTSSTVVSVAFLGEVVGASLLAWWFLGERLELAAAVGGALALAGIAAVVMRQAPAEEP